jgi:predicted transposase YbfD/YdcC
MQSTVVAGILGALSAGERRRALTDRDLRTLSRAFATVPDPRSRHGRRYDLPFLLTCLVAAVLCNCDSVDAVGQWCREQRRLLRRHFPHLRFLTPTGSLYRRLLPRLSVDHLEVALTGWTVQTRPDDDTEALTLDGKTVRGAASATQAAPHLLSVSTQQSQETLAQVRVADKTNEIPVAQALLPALPLAGRVVSADALHTQVAFAQAVLAGGGHYLLTVKGNQPTLYDDLATVFADRATRCWSAQTLDRRRGRTEQRHLRTTILLNDYLAPTWPQVGQVAQLTRRVRDKQGTRQEVVYLLTSCTPTQARPRRLLALIRGHWQVESRHWVRDVTFGEDRSRLRSGAAPQVLAAVRNLCLTLIHRHYGPTIAAARRHFASHPAHALRLLYPRPRSAR